MQTLKKFIGDKRFYLMVLSVAMPIMIQNGITNFVSLLDNIMVGQIGTEQMSGVAIVNQLLFIYNLCIFGGVSGAGIFTAQYFGQGNHEGVRNTFRAKFWIAAILTVIAVLLLGTAHEPLIRLYLTGEEGSQDMNAALRYGTQYMKLMLLGLPPFMFVQIYAGTLRETGETVTPMKAGIAAVLINLVLNYILIYGKFGAPRLGVAGAAIATVISRYVEAAIVIAWTHAHRKENPFADGLYRTLKVPSSLVKQIVVKGTPLMLNETLWAAGVAVLMQCYSVRGLNVVAGMNISNTIGNLFNVAFIALGDSVAIIVGQLLGAGKMKQARETDTKLIAFSVTLCVVIGAAMALISPLFPKLYNTTDEVRHMATIFIAEAACFMPVNAFLHASYFTLRSGGKTIITFLFDSVFIWVVSVPFAYVLSRFTNLSIYAIYLAVMSADLIKCVIGFALVKKGVWLQNIVQE
ncbi:MAG: MATE family efflux transporter [Fusicatenibacter sp.]|nr:MATE family efflux transporter [Fusicatenibacter sp.]